LVLWGSLLATFVVNNIPFYIRTPSYLIRFPEFAPRHLLDLADGYVLNYSRPILFSVYAPDQISLRVWVYAMMGIFIIYPEVLAVLVARLRQPRAKPATERRPIPVLSLVLLGILLIFLGGVVWLRLAQGFLTGDSALGALRYIMRFTVLPFFVFALLWRWTAKTKYEL